MPEDMTLQFEIRACPVIRKASAGEGQNKEGQKRTWNEGDELDAFLAAQWTSDDELSRADVYTDWLTQQFDIRGGATIQSAEMSGFSIAEMTRRAHDDNRSVQEFKRPDVTLTGMLSATDGEAFSAFLQSGLGRHKSFGYGLLRIRPT